MSEKFFGQLKKNERLKHFTLTFPYPPSIDESRLIGFFECIPNLQSLKLTILTSNLDTSFFQCLEECVSRSSLKKLHLKVSTLKILYFACLLTSLFQINGNSANMFLSYCPKNVKIALQVSLFLVFGD